MFKFMKEARGIARGAVDQQREVQAHVKKHGGDVVSVLVTPTGRVYLFPDRIVRDRRSEMPEWQPIVGVTAVVEEAGAVSARTTLTRAVIVGEGWQKASDDRRVYLQVDGPGFSWSLEVSRSGAREFAAAVSAQGRLAG